MKKLVRFLGLLGLVCSIAAPTSASTFLAMDQSQLLAASDAVVEGKVLEVESFWDRENRVILSVATIRVEQALYGDAGATIRVQTFGGTVDGYTVEASGFPKFVRGEQVLLFVNQREAQDRSIRVTGYQQGHYQITERAGERVAVPTVDEGANLIREDGRKLAPQEAMPLSELRRQIENTANELARAAQ